jgi:hypothetical protein
MIVGFERCESCTGDTRCNEASLLKGGDLVVAAMSESTSSIQRLISATAGP